MPNPPMPSQPMSGNPSSGYGYGTDTARLQRDQAERDEAKKKLWEQGQGKRT